MRTLKAALISLTLAGALSTSATAQTATFDDISASPFAWFTNYKGLSWSNAFVINPTAFFGANAGGFGTALQSGNYVLGNGGGNALSITGSNFNLLGGTFSAAWRHGMTLTAVGSHNGIAIYNQSYTLDWNTAQTLNFNMLGVDNVVFTSSGGSVHGFDAGSNASFAADDFTFASSDNEQSFGVLGVGGDPGVVPEPMTVSLMGAGLLLVGAATTRRRQRKALK